MRVVEPVIRGAPSMETVTTIAIDLAKSVFQTHAIDAAGTHRLAAERRLW
jgi:hypothetical protein